MKKKEFVLINPNLNSNPRTKIIPSNFTPKDHLNNSLALSKGMLIQNIIQKTLRDIGARDIVNNVIGLSASKLDSVSQGLVEFLESKGMIENTQKPSPSLQNANSNRRDYGKGTSSGGNKGSSK